MFFENKKFPLASFDFNWDSLWFYLAKLGREIRFGSLEIMKYEKYALRSTMKGEGKEGKTIGGKSIYFYDWMQLRRQRFSVIFSAIFHADKKTIDKNKFSTTDQLRLHCIFFLQTKKNGDFKHFILFVVFFVLAIFFSTHTLLLSDVPSFLQKVTLKQRKTSLSK